VQRFTIELRETTTGASRELEQADRGVIIAKLLSS
jgi:hypothetical protein